MNQTEYHGIGNMSFDGGQSALSESPGTGSSKRMILVICVCAAVLAVLVAVAIHISDSPEKDKADSSKKEEVEMETDESESVSWKERHRKAAENFMNLMVKCSNGTAEEEDFQLWLESYPDSCVSIKEYAEAMYAGLDENEGYEDEYDFSLEYKDIKKAEKEELEEYGGRINEMEGMEDVEITAGSWITYEMSDTYGDAEDITILVLECDGEPSVWGISDNTEIVFFDEMF